ncbi:putative F-box domain, leucine-rich repeat domain, L domain-containing protein [Rosa chinensis]|uniref:Putative F-box domain, leucine-rich repeat domain, L domain-containing protein n=1 Tax=Rosa chinensis TaxID=74649 RepID=A0A2P6RC29_ROSCH|nr:putative F-box domain, leucine-rich repeat domain, L domain-containing protein [Rosa chinensis]
MLSAVGGSEAQVAPRDRKLDRFSGLPDNVAHHILSFLNFRALTRLGGVSKRCREWYLSNPSFDIYDYGRNKQDQLGLLNFIGRFLVHRGNSKMPYVRISWGFCSGISDEIFQLITWIQIAIRCNVEELEFQVMNWHSPETIEFPSCIVLCRSLRSLVLDFHAILKFPTFASFTSLQNLELKHVG